GTSPSQTITGRSNGAKLSVSITPASNASNTGHILVITPICPPTLPNHPSLAQPSRYAKKTAYFRLPVNPPPGKGERPSPRTRTRLPTRGKFTHR
ncbi:MAG: hypothetical protein GWO24_11885, partial [Akkermansiaceae bacterium]|nr:hypothetical protein [Akkermansiaceae bacterium]